MLIFTDMQTTGVEADDLLCSIALLHEETLWYELVNEGKKIPPLASSLHNITNEMIQEKEPFQKTQIYNFLQQNNNIEAVLIGHNVKFYGEKLAKSGLEWKGSVIDTKRVTKHLIPECELFSLQFLRYELKLYRQENRVKHKYGIKDAFCSHNALHDVLLTQILFEHLLEYASVQEMKTLTFQNVLLEKFTFGKYMGKYIEEIVLNDQSYIRWMLNLEDLDEDLRYSLEYYLRG